jgi:hypothetical protein
MSVKIKSKKIIAGAILVALMGSYLPGFSPVPKASAQTAMDFGDYLSVPIKEYGNTADKFTHTGISVWGYPLKFTSLDYWMKYAVKKIIQELQDQVVGWIREGANGNPIFETNLMLFLDELRNTTGNNYLDQLGAEGSPLCGYLRNDIVTGLSSYFNLPNGGSNANAGSTCAAENYLGKDKLAAFLGGDVQNGGGWDAWSAVTQYDNSNPLGAFLVNQDRLQQAVSKKQGSEREKLVWGEGFHSIEDANGDIKTPGNVINDQIKHVLRSDLNQLELVKTFDDLVTALADSWIDSVIKDNNGLRGSNNGRSNTGQTSTIATKTRGSYVRGDPPTNSAGSNSDDQAGGEQSEDRVYQNVSIGGTASASSVLDASDDDNGIVHEARLALSGSNNRNPRSGVFISKPQQDPWWQVDLKRQRTIDHIDITPRIDDGYGNNLDNFYVIISQNPITGNTIPASGNGVWVSEEIDVANPRADITTVTPPTGTTGRYVRIQQLFSGRLEIAGVEVFSKRAPIVTLLGSNPMTVRKGSVFEDPGAAAVDQYDANVSDTITVTGSVNTAVPGTYTITYTAKNSIDVSASVRRTVIVQ